MDPISAGVGGAMAVGGLFATLKGSKEMKKAKKYLRENKALWKALQTPDLENLKVKLEQAASQGKLDPKIGQAILQDPSAMQDVGADPKLVQAQEQSLGALQRIAQSGGQDATTRARMAQTMGQVGQQERASREALQAQMQRRGIGGGGTDIASQMLAQQQSAGQAAQMGFQTAADAEQRALQAIAQSGQMAGQMRSQQVGEDAARAQAMDRINQFNTQHRQQLQASNYAALNAAEAANLQAAQQLENQNVGRRESRNLQHTQAYQTDFANRAKKTQGMAGANTALAGHQQGLGQMWGQFGGSLLGSGGSMLAAGLKPAKTPDKPLTPQAQPQQMGARGFNTDRMYDRNRLRSADGAVVTSDNQGGMVPGNSYAGDRVDAQVNSGEMILNVEQQQNLLDLLAGRTNDIDSSIPIVQEAPQVPPQDQQMPEEESMLDPLAAAAQEQQAQQPMMPQQQQPMMPQQPMEDPMAALAQMPQEQPIQAADGAIAPQPWQQVVYPPKEGYTPMTPMDPTAPVAPVPTAPQGPVQTDAPLETVNVPDTQMAPVTEFGQSPQTPVEQPYVDPAQQQPQQPQQGGTDYLSLLTGSPKGSGIPGAIGGVIGGGLSALAMAADPDTAMGIDRETRARDEREKVRTERKQQMEQDKLEKMASAQQERLQKQADAAKKREQDLADFTKKEQIKKDVASEAKVKEGTRKKSFNEVRSGWSSEQSNTANLASNMIDEYANIERLLSTKGFSLADIAIRTQLTDAISAFANFALRKDSGAAIGDVEREEFAKFLPQLKSGTVNPELLKAQVRRMGQWMENVASSLGTDLPSFTDHLDSRLSGFYKNTLPGGFFKYGQGKKEDQAQGSEFTKISDQDLDAEIAAEEAKMNQ